MTSDNKDFFESIPEYISGQISLVNKARFEAELSSSESLRLETDRARKILGRLKSVPEFRVSRDLVPDILARIEREEFGQDMKPVKVVPFRRWLVQLVPAAVAAMLLIAVWMGYDFSPNSGDRGGHIVAQATQVGNAREMACKWLASRQLEAGGWNITKYGGKNGLDSGVAGLALIAFSEQGDDYRKPARKVADYLCALQDKDGSLGGDSGAAMYNHGIASYALAKARERFGFNGIDDVLGKAVAYTIKCQGTEGGWGYGSSIDEFANIGVTAWQVNALDAAERVGVSVPGKTMNGALAYVRKLVDGGSVRYSSSVGGSSETMIAMGASCLLLHKNSDVRKTALELVGKIKVVASERMRGNDPYREFFVALAYKRAGEGYDGAARSRMELLASRQAAVGDEVGSFAPETTIWGGQGGTVFTTAMAAACLR